MNTVEVVEDEIPDLELPDLNGRKRRLQALQGKYVFLNFWHENDQTSNRLFMEYKKGA
jgi:peroxiredoxin